MRFHELRFALRCFAFLGALALLLPLAVGCGSRKGTVSGTVTLDGQPLAVGTIAFIPSQGPGASAPIEDGKYSVERVPTGKVSVTVDANAAKRQIDSFVASTQGRGPNAQYSADQLAHMPENAKKQVEEGKKQAEEAAAKVKDLKAKYRPIPEKYAKAESSGLTLEVKSGSNTFDVQLSSK